MTPPAAQTSQPMPTEIAVALQRQVSDLSAEVQRLHEDLRRQTVTVSSMEARLPNSSILSQKFLTRAFAIWGHTFVAGLIIGIVFYCGLFILGIGLGSLGELLNY